MTPTPPRYGQASLGDVLPGALAALGVPGCPDPLELGESLHGIRRVAVLLVDGLGLRLIPAAARYSPTLAEVHAGRLGTLRQLTSGFPSTTPTSLVSLATGAPPGAHGVLGFTVNVPGSDRVLTHIYWRDEPDPAQWQPIPNLFGRAAAAGVRTTAVGRPEFVGAALTTTAYGGAEYRSTTTVEELATTMLAALTGPGPALVYGYHGTVDSRGHVYGLGSEQWADSITELDRLLSLLVAGLPADAALLVTADHGQLDVPASHRFDIDADPRLGAGIRVVAGEPRVRYLHTLPGATCDVLDAWRAVLGPAAWVGSRDEVVAAGWFGAVPEGHLQRIGDVVVVCQDDYAVLATAHEPPTVAALIALHGSWTPEEMLIPLITIRGS